MNAVLTSYFGIVGNNTLLTIMGLGIMAVVVYALYSFFD